METLPELDREIARAVQAIPGIAALALFGSRASGKARPDSDLDVAVLPTAGADRRDLQVSVAVALADLAPKGRVDVVLLDEAPELLRHNVLAGGRLVLCRDEQAWRDLRIWTMREHGDREWARDVLREAQWRRLARGEAGGRSGHALESLERTRGLRR
jgi:predicted nucleotidyltransferase